MVRFSRFYLQRTKTVAPSCSEALALAVAKVPPQYRTIAWRPAKARVWSKLAQRLALPGQGAAGQGGLDGEPATRISGRSRQTPP